MKAIDFERFLRNFETFLSNFKVQAQERILEHIVKKLESKYRSPGAVIDDIERKH